MFDFSVLQEGTPSKIRWEGGDRDGVERERYHLSGKQSGKSDRVLDIDTAALPPLAVVELGRRGERHLWGIC